MAREVRVTKEGYERLQQRVEQERERLDEATRILRELSGTSDDYDDTGLEEAKREKALIEDRLDDLEDQLSRAVVIEAHEMDAVELGAIVELEDASGDTFSVQVVAPVEAGVLEGDVPHISDESPMGKALIGRRVGDEVDVVTGEKSVRYTVVSIG
jgi:transcription elongation factor GreA